MRTKVREALGSELGRKGSSRKGVSRAVRRPHGGDQQFAERACPPILVRTVQEEADIPRAFNSSVHPRKRAWTSSGAISVRDQASVQEGFGVGGFGSWTTAAGLATFLGALESLLLLKTREKKGITTVQDADDGSGAINRPTKRRYQSEEGYQTRKLVESRQGQNLKILK